MSQRLSGYKREPGDLYETPPWVTNALAPYMKGVRAVWDPCAGNGAMSNVIANWAGVRLMQATDINAGVNFLEVNNESIDAIICNPPYDQAQAFITHALRITRKMQGRVGMLLRVDFDSAKTRRHLFGGCSEFSCKLVLCSRIRWFAESKGSPSFNHAWYIWDWTHIGPPVIKYHYEPDGKLEARAEALR